jgi:hypothetical protein
VPLTLASVDCDGEEGLMLNALGPFGATVSLVKLTALEQPEMLPAASVAVAE